MQDVLWVPSDPTQFVTWGSDIRHYLVTRDLEVTNQKPVYVNQQPIRGLYFSWTDLEASM